MKDIYSVLLTDTLPYTLKNKADVIALSYALRKELDKICGLLPMLSCIADIDNMTGALCDYFAVELDALYYDKHLPLERKRELIKTALQLHDISGTYKAVETVVKAVLGTATVYDGMTNKNNDEFDPYTFDVITDIPLNNNSIHFLNKIIHKVKPVRSELRQISVKHENYINIYVGSLGNSRKLINVVYSE